MTRWVAIGIAMAAAVALPEPAPAGLIGGEAANNPSQRLKAIFADYWLDELRSDPLEATFVGDHRFDDRLPGAAPTDWQRRHARSHAFRERLRALERADLTPADQLNYAIFARVLDNTIAELEFRSY